MKDLIFNPGRPGAMRKAGKALWPARAAADEFDILVDHLEESHDPWFAFQEWIETSCFRLADHAIRLIEALRSCRRLPWGPRRMHLHEEAEAWAGGVAHALRRAMALAESIRDEYHVVDDVTWLVDLHATGHDALRRVARLEAYLAEAM